MTVNVFPLGHAKTLGSSIPPPPPFYDEDGSGGEPRKPKIKIVLPVLHPDQVRAWKLPARFKAVQCGRRWGKTDLAKTVVADDLIKGRLVGWFAPDYKTSSEAFVELAELLAPMIENVSRVQSVIRLKTGGRIDFWTLANNDRAGRSRKYHRIIIDEGAFTTNGKMMDTWQKSIKPTLLDYKGSALVCSNTNGISDDNFFWQICNEPIHGFKVFHAPSAGNPYLPKDELAKLERDNPPLVYQQEYLAEFVDWSGHAFFSRDKLLHEGLPVPYPTHCDFVYVVMDTATKTGQEHDGTAILYIAKNINGSHGGVGFTHELTLLDWELEQVQGAMLEYRVPTILARAEELAVQCGARMGSFGLWIEDKASGMVLIQHAQNREWPVHPIESKLTMQGKVERAVSASPYIYQNKVKISGHAFDKQVMYKGHTRNHLLAQIVGFRVGDTETDEDDLLDTFTYGTVIGLGNAEGFG